MKNTLLLRVLLAVRNVFRQRVRTAATLAAISIGVAGLILSAGFVEDIFVQLGEAIIHSQSGHLQVTKAGYREGRYRAPENYLIPDPASIKARLLLEPGVANVMARISFAGVLNNGRRDLGIIGEGGEPGPEAALGTYLRYVEGRALRDGDRDGMVVGYGVARSLGLKIGDRVTLVMTLAQGAVNTLDFEVVGIFQSFSKDFDARAVRISMDSARTLLDTQGAQVLVVTLRDTFSTDAVAKLIRNHMDGDGFEVITWRELSDFYEKTVEMYARQFGVLRLIILLMVLLSVANSINMTLFERTREFGTMLALGDRSTTVFQLILAEAVLTGLLGALLGVLLGALVAVVASFVGIPMPPPPNANLGYTAAIRLVPAEMGLAAAVGFMATCLAAVIPARRASRLDVVDALRHGQ